MLAGACAGPSPAGVKPGSARPGSYSGSIAGADYKIEIPAHWNGTLLLYSHGYAAPDGGNPASDAGDPTTAAWLRANGYALAGSSYRTTGWALQEAFQDQVALLDHFTRVYGKPRRTIAWGHSLGGTITAGLVQLHPERLDGALAMCGVLAGGIANWNGALDIGFATQTLLDNQLQVVAIRNPGANLTAARSALTAASKTAEGRARISLIASLGHLPGWFNPLQPEPGPDDVSTRLNNQASWEAFDFSYVFAYRAELERRAGGNPSWNTGVDYQKLFAQSPNHAQTESLYLASGLNLQADLARLGAAPRISADPAAVTYLSRNITFNGRLAVPVVTLHTTDDGLVVPENEAAYQDVVAAGSDSSELRQLFTHRANHCVFTPAEQIAALQTIVRRLDTGSWPSTNPEVLNAQAASLGAGLNGGSLPGSQAVIPAPPAFIDYRPARFPRSYDSRSAG